MGGPLAPTRPRAAAARRVGCGGGEGERRSAFMWIAFSWIAARGRCRGERRRRGSRRRRSRRRGREPSRARDARRDSRAGIGHGRDADSRRQPAGGARSGAQERSGGRQRRTCRRRARGRVLERSGSRRRRNRCGLDCRRLSTAERRSAAAARRRKSAKQVGNDSAAHGSGAALRCARRRHLSQRRSADELRGVQEEGKERKRERVVGRGKREEAHVRER